MSNNLPIPPALISVPRIRTLVASLFVSLGCGTNYVYSAYSPQLGARLKMSHTQLNIVALAANVGVFSTGPIWGKIVDSRGPRILLACSFVSLLGGYSGIRFLYDSGLAPDALSAPAIIFYTLLLCSFLTGVGGSGGITGSINTITKTFPDRARASTIGLVMSGYGLSAFLFSTISHIFFVGRVSPLLLLLSLGSSIPMMLGFFFVRPVPLPVEESNREVYLETDSSSYEQRNSTGSGTPLLNHHEDDDDAQPNPSLRSQNCRSRGGAAMPLDMLPNVYGKKLWCSSDFWLLFSIYSILGGTGLMYINNVGSMSQCLYAYNNPYYDDVVGSGWQAAQVSTISIMNFSGRIFIGLVSDIMKKKYGMPRSYCLTLVASIFFISQIVTGTISDIAHLWIASALVGLAYGSAFSLLPTVCLEWFGLPHFSENLGYLFVSPIVGGNLFSLLFGRNLDAHKSSPPNHPSSHNSLMNPPPPPLVHVFTAPPQCSLGLNCYRNTIYLTVFATFLAVLLSVWAGYRDWLKIVMLRKVELADRRDLIWQDEDAG